MDERECEIGRREGQGAVSYLRVRQLLYEREYERNGGSKASIHTKTACVERNGTPMYNVTVTGALTFLFEICHLTVHVTVPMHVPGNAFTRCMFAVPWVWM